jgi:hypothetical protein
MLCRLYILFPSVLAVLTASGNQYVIQFVCFPSLAYRKVLSKVSVTPVDALLIHDLYWLLNPLKAATEIFQSAHKPTLGVGIFQVVSLQQHLLSTMALLRHPSAVAFGQALSSQIQERFFSASSVLRVPLDPSPLITLKSPDTALFPHQPRSGWDLAWMAAAVEPRLSGTFVLSLILLLYLFLRY